MGVNYTLPNLLLEIVQELLQTRFGQQLTNILYHTYQILINIPTVIRTVLKFAAPILLELQLEINVHSNTIRIQII